MTFKTSLFNKGLILNTLKRFWWVSALYTLLLFFILPLRHMMLKDAVTNEWIKNQITESLNLASHQNGFQFILILLMPVVLATLTFRYIQKNNMASMLHSLPYTRKTLYISHSTAGLLLLTLPVIFIAIVLTVLQFSTNLKDYYSILHIVEWGGFTLLFHLIFYSIAVFVGMFTGSSTAQMVFTYILHFLPAGLYLLINQNLNQLLYGYSGQRSYDPLIDYLPLFTILNARIGVEDLSLGRILSYIVVSILFFTVAYYVYKIRNIEVAGDVIAFKGIRPLFKYGVTICSMLLGGAYFTSIAGGGFATIVFGYIFSSFLGYWVAEMLMEKSFRVWREGARGYLAYTLLMLLVLGGIHMDLTGYVNRIPQPQEVEMVYLGHLYEWEQKQGKVSTRATSGSIFETEENIQNITQLHRELIEGRNHRIGRQQHIIYVLQDGSHLIRQYPIDEDRYAAALAPIYESQEHKEGRFPLLQQSPEEIKWIEVVDYRSQKQPLMLTNQKELQEFVPLLQEDILDADFNDLRLNRSNYLTAVITDHSDQQNHYALHPDYTNVLQWLKVEGYYDDLALLPEEVDYVVLEKGGRNASPNKVEIREKEVIEELLTLHFPVNYYTADDIIHLSFYSKGQMGRPIYTEVLYDLPSASPALKHYLEKL